MLDAAREVKRPDSFYLAPCLPIEKSTSDKLEDILELIQITLDQYGLCMERHNLLIEQL